MTLVFALVVYCAFAAVIAVICIARGFTIASSLLFGFLFITVFASPRNWLRKRGEQRR